MGWLKDLMNEMAEPASSFTALAKQVLASPALRSGSALKANSLAAYMGKLDEEKDLTALEEHPNERRALAKLLGLSLEDFDRRLQERKAPRSAQKDFRLDLSDIRLALIDLRTDELPPGIPEEVLVPPRWPLWWNAPSGSGRTLAGKWLEARGLATFVQADTWENAEPHLMPDIPNYVELSSPAGIPRPEEVIDLRFCVAVEGLPVTMQASVFGPEHVVDPSWAERVVHPPPVQFWLEDLLHYLEARRPSDSDFDAQQCLEWMRKELLPNRLIDGLGAALGFAGLFASYHHRLKGDSGQAKLSRLAERFLRLRRDQLESTAAVPLPQLWKALRHMARRLLSQGDSPWNAARSLSSWYELARTQPDALTRRWLQEPQVKEALQVEDRKLKKALDALPPDEYRTIQYLRDLGLLREQQPRIFALRPQWLLHVMTEEAAEELLAGAPSEWGAALLYAHGAPRILRHLVQRCDRGDFEPVRQLLGTPEPDSAAWVAALEGSVRALGLCALMGRAVPEDLATRVFDWQQHVAISRYGGDPYPRLDFKGSRDELLLTRGLWLASCHALSEKLKRSPDWPHPVLAPWSGELPPEPLRGALSELWSVVRHKQARERLRLDVLSLGARLLDILGPQPSYLGPVDPILAPEFLLRCFQQGTLSWNMLGEHSYWYEILPVLPPYLKMRGVPWEGFARAIWDAWLASGKDSNSLFFGEEKAPLLWKHLPPAVILDARFAALLFHERVPYAAFQAEHWDAFLAVWKQRKAPDLSEEKSRPWRSMPETHVRRAIAEGLLHPHEHHIYRVLWERMPQVLLEELHGLFLQTRWDPALQLAWSAPPDRMREVLDLIEKVEFTQSDVPRERLVHWLHEFIGQRVPGWEEAWMVLGRLARVEAR